MQPAEVGAERLVSAMGSHIMQLVARFVSEEAGQDLIEYALLTAIVTVSSVLIFSTIQGKIGNSYFTWQSLGQDRWIPDPPLAP
jgi:Flp pilus assembly pilin Flp